MSADPFDGWAIPDGWTASNIGQCRSCGATILWCITPAGKKAPVDRDGASHFSSCPQASTWRRRVPVRATPKESPRADR